MTQTSPNHSKPSRLSSGQTNIAVFVSWKLEDVQGDMVECVVDVEQGIRMGESTHHHLVCKFRLSLVV